MRRDDRGGERLPRPTAARFGRVDWDEVHARARRAARRARTSPSTPRRRSATSASASTSWSRSRGRWRRKPRVLILDEPTAALAEQRGRPAARHRCAICATGASPASTSPTSSTRCSRSPTASPCCATAQPSGTSTRRRHQRARGHPPYGRARDRATSSRRAARRAPARRCCRCGGLRVAPSSGKPARSARHVASRSRAGEVLGIGGLMGAGRTELLMHLFGALRRRAAPAASSARGGARRSLDRAARGIARGLVLVSEDRKRYGLVLDQDVGFNLSLSALGRLARAAVHRPHARARPRNRAMSPSCASRRRRSTAASARSPAATSRRSSLGKALMTEPRVLLLDEPTRGIDVGAKVEVYELIEPARGRRQGRRAGLERTARTAGHERPDPDAARRPRRRAVRARRGDPGTPARRGAASGRARAKRRAEHCAPRSAGTRLDACWRCSRSGRSSPGAQPDRSWRSATCRCCRSSCPSPPCSRWACSWSCCRATIDLSVGSGVGLAGGVAAVLIHSARRWPAPAGAARSLALVRGGDLGGHGRTGGDRAHPRLHHHPRRAAGVPRPALADHRQPDRPDRRRAADSNLYSLLTTDTCRRRPGSSSPAS